MPTSAIGNRPNISVPLDRSREAYLDFARYERIREGGFTLIELLIVLAIVGLAAAAVVIAMPDPRGRLSDEAERFAARAIAARDLAIIEGRPVAVRVTAQGYAFDRKQGRDWAPLPDASFRSHPWSRGTAALVGQGGTIRTVFDQTGQPSAPATIMLARGGERVRIAIGADGGVRVGH